MTEPKIIADDIVVQMYYILTVDNKKVDASPEGEPIEFLQGHENIIPGLEQALYGMASGDSKDVVVAAVDGYGEFDPDQVVDMDKEQFPEEMPLKVGTRLKMRDEDGQILHGHIHSVVDETVKVNFNHPLAGKELKFAVTIGKLRAATEEELAHGHIHNGDTH